MSHTPNLTRGAIRLAAITLFAALLSAAVVPMFAVAAPLVQTTTVGLGTAGNFAVLAGSAVNDTSPSVITGDVGLSPAAWGAGLTCLEVTGAIYSVDASGPLPCRQTNAPLLTTAKSDLTTAFTDAAGRGATTIATELGNVTLIDGVYDSLSTTFQISNIGALTLDGQGDPNAVFIFKMGSTAASLVTASNSSVALINGAQACNVFWQVSGSATLGTGTTFVGTIMADQSITDNGGSRVNGRFLARIAAVTLNNTTISRSVCAAATATPAATPGPQPSYVSVEYPCAVDDHVVVSVGLSAGVIVYGLGEPITSATDTGDAKIVRILPFGHYDWNAVPPPGHYMLTASSGVVDPVRCVTPTATATTPPVVGLPATGGASPRRDGFLWAAALAASVVGALGIGLSIRARRRARQARR